MYSTREIRWMHREELIDLLHGAGFATSGLDTNDELRQALIEHYETEGLISEYN